MADSHQDKLARADAEHVERAWAGALPAVVILAIGVTICLCGSLGLFMESTDRTEGTGDTASVLLTAGTLLFLVGFVWLRIAFRKAAYRVTHPFSPALALVMALLLLVVGALPFGLAALLDNAGVRIAAGPLLIVLLPPLVMTYVRFNTALVMNPVAVAIGGQQIPWPSIAAIVVAGADGEKQYEVSARLRPDAPPPTSTAADSGDSAAAPGRVEISRRRLNLSKLAGAVARFGPPGVAVIERGPAGERLISAR